MAIRWKTTDSHDAIRYTALDAHKQPVNLIGATARFLMGKRGDADSVIINEPAQVVDEMAGKLAYELTEIATLEAGTFNAEFHVEWPDGSRKVFPSEGYLAVTVAPSLDVNKVGEVEERIILRVSQIEEFKDEIVAKVDGFKATVGQAEDAAVEAEAQADYAKAQGDYAKIEADRVAGMDVSKLTAQLAETANLQNQVDYVKMVRDHNITNLKMKTRVKGDRIIEVFVPLSNNEYARYEFGKDANDDYIKLHNGETAIKSNNDLRVGKNYDTNSGIWSTSSKNHYTTQIGATFTVSFTGHKFEFCYFADTRGGVWEFVVDGDTSNKKTFSTYGSANPGVATIFTELEDTEHTVIATFKGDDPNNVPSSGAGTSRGWVYYNDGTTNYYSVFATTKGELTKQLDILYPSSNKEFAIQVSPLNSGFSPQWLPEHNAIGTVFTVDQKVMIDGVEITDWIAQPFYKEASKLQIIQKMTCKHPDDTSNPVAEIYSVHTVTSTGVSVTVKIKWLRDVSITNGYGMMFPVYTSFANELITSLKNRYPSVKTDGSSTNLVSEKDGAISFAYINNTKTDESANTIVAMTITDMKGTYRQGKSGRRSQSIAWLQHRSTELQKLYLHTFAATTALAGETYEVSGEFIIGKLPMAANLIA